MRWTRLTPREGGGRKGGRREEGRREEEGREEGGGRTKLEMLKIRAAIEEVIEVEERKHQRKKVILGCHEGREGWREGTNERKRNNRGSEREEKVSQLQLRLLVDSFLVKHFFVFRVSV